MEGEFVAKLSPGTAEDWQSRDEARLRASQFVSGKQSIAPAFRRAYIRLGFTAQEPFLPQLKQRLPEFSPLNMLEYDIA